MQVQRDPSTSLVAHVDYSTGFRGTGRYRHERRSASRYSPYFLFGVVGFVFGAKQYGWYIAELNAVFLGIGIITALIARMSPGDTSQTFLEGAAAMTAAALIVGFARTIEVVLSDGQIIDSIVHSYREPARRHAGGGISGWHAGGTNDLQLLHTLWEWTGLRHHADHVAARDT